MTRTLIQLATAMLLLITASRLPAPISEESPTPKSTRPKSEISSPKAKSSPTAEASMSSRAVQVVLTENTRAAILYLKNYVQQYETMAFAGKSDVRPDEILEQLRHALSTRFSNVSIPSGSSSSRGGGLTMFFDLQAHVGSVSFTSSTVSFTATFKNGAGRTLQTISASGKSTVPYPNFFGTQFPKAASKAFADFSQKLNTAR